jgi:cystathionine beta-lyase family protein involved in aluminum resistance
LILRNSSRIGIAIAFIYDELSACNTFDDESNRRRKPNLKRIVSMFTRLIQRSESVSEGSIAYGYDDQYRDAEYQYETHRSAES